VNDVEEQWSNSFKETQKVYEDNIAKQKTKKE